MSINLKLLGLGLAAIATALVLTPPVAQANLVLSGGTVQSSFVSLSAQGFGAAPRLLTEQTTGVESGSVTPVDVVHGDAISGANKSTTPTLSTLGWTSGSQVNIGFNSDQVGQTGITLQSLTLTIFNGTTAIGNFSLASPVTFTAADLALQQGNGQAVFDFVLTPAEQTQFNTLLALTGSSGFFAGLSSTLGCPAGAPAGCQPSNDGPDSFIGFAGPSIATPEPASLALFGSMLIGLAGITYVMRRRREDEV